MKKTYTLFILSLLFAAAQAQINTSLPVGAIAGKADVSPTGAATYTIPIEVPPGTAGMQPDLSIVYNSQSGDGIMGLGWNFTGISAITRTGQTIYHDGKVTGIILTDDDRFMWDGNRLLGGFLSKSSSSMETIQVYPEVGFNNQVFVHWDTQKGPHDFYIKTSDGKILEYGATSDSRVEFDGVSVIWYLNKVTDANGNYMTYHYESGGTNTKVLSKIAYTGNASAGFSPYNEIRFTYTTKMKNIKAFVAGKEMVANKILEKITTLVEGNIVQIFQFVYDLNDQSDLQDAKLKEIKQIAKDGSSLNSTKIVWGSLSDRVTVSDVTGYLFSDLGLIISEPTNSDGQSNVAAFKNGSGSVTYYSLAPDASGTNFSSSIIRTANSDDLPKLLRTVNFESATSASYLFAKVGDAGYIDYEFENNSMYNFSVRGDHQVLQGDFNGDQKEEIVIIHRNLGTPGYCYMEHGQNITTGSNISNFDPEKIYLTDINGNGKKEFMIVKDGNSYFYELNSSTRNFELLYQSGYPTKWHKIYTGDFNGDGKTDLLTFAEAANPKKWEIAYSTGTNFVFETNPLYFSDFQYVSETFVNDFNGDGRDDVMQVSSSSAGNNYGSHVLFYSRGNGTFTWEQHPSNVKVPDPKQNYKFGDFNGDGKIEFITAIRYAYTSDHQIMSFYKNDQSRLVSSINNGIGYSANFNYKPLLKRNEDNLYNPAEITDPVCAYRGGLQAVSQIVFAGCGSPQTISYAYGPLLYHSQGKGFLGFKTTKITNQKNQQTVASLYDYTRSGYGYYNLFLKNTKVTVQNLLISEQILKNNLMTKGKRFSPVVDTAIAIDYLLSTTVTTINEYYPSEYVNNYPGYLKSSKQDFGQGCTTTTSYEYSIHGTVGIADYIFKPSKVTTSATHKDDTTSNTIVKTLNYDAKGNLLSEVDFFGKPQAVTTEYSNFNAFGLAETITTSTPQLSSRYKTVAYDAKKRFVEKITDMNSLETKTEYDYATGNVTKTTDSRGNNTTYEYDGFGRLKKTNTPIGTTQTQLYWGNAGGGPSNALYYSLTTGNNMPPATTYYDTRGREICSKTCNFKNEAIFVDKEYTDQGQLWRQSKPYFQNETKRWVTYSYDNYGRVTSVVDIDGNTTISYNGKTTTTTRPDYTQTSKTVNAMGQTVSSTDNGGTVTYLYYSNGNPQSITAAGVTTTMEYDDYGRQTKLVDANAGTTRYEYNAWGELTKQTDARNQETRLYYYDDGRLRSKSTPEGSYFYDYYTSGIFKTMLQFESSPDDSYFEYVYDNLGRQTQITQYEPALGSSFVTQYSYDAHGNLLTTTYPTGFKTKNRYDNYGYGNLVEISRDYSGGTYNQPGVGTSIWQIDQQNASGQITKWIAGHTGLHPKRVYNSYDLLTNINCGTLQNMSYEFDPENGNLLKRTDNSRMTIETFTYDNLDRLTGISVFGPNPGSWAMTYNNNGNIATKTDAGTYAYDNQKKHALKNIIGNNDIPLATQTATYTSFSSVKTVKDFIVGTNIPIEAKFKYAPDNQRSLMQVYKNDLLQYTKFYGQQFEQVTKGANPYDASQRRNFHYIAAPGGASMVYISHGNNVNTGQLFYLLTDHQGSITHIVNEWGGLALEYSYDAWGRRRNPGIKQPYAQSFFQTVSNLPLIDNFCTFDRGYTGHEHLDAFGLINMNGRLYDPVMGRMLSPDNYVQDPGSTQSHNRYAYCLNNPLKYVDPSGEKWWHWALGAALIDPVAAITAATVMANSALTTAGVTYASALATAGMAAGTAISFDQGYTYVGAFRNSEWAGQRFDNSLKMFGGLFQTDENRNFGANAWMLFSRWTWESPQTITGLGYSHFRNLSGQVDRVDYLGGATFLTNENSGSRDGVTLGNYINMNIDQEITGDFTDYVLSDPMYMHEYGHTIDSRIYGPSYLVAIGIPSLISADGLEGVPGQPYNTHDIFWTEIRANKHAARYFKKYYGIPWNFLGYPLFNK